MKKFQFILSVIILTGIAILAVTSFIIVFLGFTTNSFHNVDLGSLAAFDIVFWLCGRLFAPVVRDCYDDWQEEKTCQSK